MGKWKSGKWEYRKWKSGELENGRVGNEKLGKEKKLLQKWEESWREKRKPREWGENAFCRFVFLHCPFVVKFELRIRPEFTLISFVCPQVSHHILH